MYVIVVVAVAKITFRASIKKGSTNIERWQIGILFLEKIAKTNLDFHY